MSIVKGKNVRGYPKFLTYTLPLTPKSLKLHFFHNIRQTLKEGIKTLPSSPNLSNSPRPQIFQSQELKHPQNPTMCNLQKPRKKKLTKQFLPAMRYGNGDEPRDGSKQSADTSPKYGPLSNLPISIAHQCHLKMCTEKHLVWFFNLPTMMRPLLAHLHCT